MIYASLTLLLVICVVARLLFGTWSEAVAITLAVAFVGGLLLL